ncbi:FimB/Mfa2 family fimbrial subunit [Bacteroides faecium]|uniref:FimB/Mfa2 family fimbrial subunit n=1 Tax=Bacteroides faecium TaxID=2715212 RepID=A0A6H0KVD5_9BACE|nr:FimB/Mfa2 family fimbrial subunit [Bacteroides faecium]QIU97113.1 FimB/Mfa2 family fimbrial subunit [Bacteroides faecium]
MRKIMNTKGVVRRMSYGSCLLLLLVLFSCTSIDETLPECQLYVRFQYDYNMEFTDAFAAQVNCVDVFVFDKEGTFIIKKSEQGETLGSGSYRMPLSLPVGEYRIAAWAGMSDAFEMPELVVGKSILEDLTVRMKRGESLVHNKVLKPLWYGEVKNVSFTGKREQTETVRLIKDTNKFRFILQKSGPGEELDMNDCLFEIRADNGYYDWNNDLLNDDVISYQPYHLEKVEDVGIVAEMNTMRLLEHKKVYLTLTRKSDSKVLMKIDLIPYLLLTKMEGHDIPAQEYLDRQSEYAIVFFYNPELLNFLSTKIVINGWTIWLKGEDL